MKPLALFVVAASPFTSAFALSPPHRTVAAACFDRCTSARLEASVGQKSDLVAATSPVAPPQPTLLEWLAVERAAVPGVLSLVALHAVLRRLLAWAGITFPASIVGMLGGFGALCSIRAWSAPAAERLVRFLSPACRLFRTWLAALFAPGLITLPLVMPALPAGDLVAFFAIAAIGFVTSLATGAGVATMLGTFIHPAPRMQGHVVPSSSPAPPPLAAAAPYVPFPRSQQRFLSMLAVGGAAVHVATGSALALTLSQLATTLGAFSLATTLSSPAVQVAFHPFLQCSAATLLACGAVGAATGAGGRAVLAAYAASTGAGGCLQLLLGPCVLSFALQLYTYRQPLSARAVQIVGSAVMSTFASMVTAAAAARALGLANVLRKGLLFRTTTTALATEIGRLLEMPPVSAAGLNPLIAPDCARLRPIAPDYAPIDDWLTPTAVRRWASSPPSSPVWAPSWPGSRSSIGGGCATQSCVASR